MIPKGWSGTNLLDLSSNGLMNGAFNDPKLVGTGYKLINVVNLYSDPYIKTTELELLNLPSSDYDKFKAEKGDIFFTRSSLKLEGIAHCNIFLDNRDDVIFECHIIRVRPNKKKVDPRYLHYYCVSPNARKHFMSYAKTTTMTTIDQNGIGSLTVLLPPLPEQRKIAEILSSWDKAIALLEQLITAKRKLKQGLMQQLLTAKKRFKEFEGSEWKNENLIAIAQVLVSPVDKKTIDGEIPVRLCNYTDVYHNIKITKSLNFMEATATEQEIAKFTLKKGDVIITKDSETPNDIAVPAYVSEDVSGVICGYHLAILRPIKNKVDGEYLNYILMMPKTRYYFFTLANGATRFGLSVGSIEKAHFHLPPIPEQQKIAFILSAADTEISTLEKQLAAYKQQKRGLMQQLLTGKKRVKLDEPQMLKV